jgi:hypothetical protein
MSVNNLVVRSRASTSSARNKAGDCKYYASLLSQVETELKAAQSNLEQAREIVTKAGLSCDSGLLWTTTTSTSAKPTNITLLPSSTASSLSTGTVTGASIAATAAASISGTSTGGHSNTDHLIIRTGIDETTDRVLEYRRLYQIRRRYIVQPEQRGDDKWDKPHRVPGERRRRIVREKDLPCAPPEPPPSGYVVFLGQMTTKIRHDRINERHDQTRIVQEISKMWKHGLTDADREYYNKFCLDVRQEYKKQHMEFRATGYYTPSTTFERNTDGAGLWVRKKIHEKNRLELEIATYDTVKFPLRPPSFNDEHKRRELESRRKRKEKLKHQQQQSTLVKRRRSDDVTPTETSTTPSST